MIEQIIESLSRRIARSTSPKAQGITNTKYLTSREIYPGAPYEIKLHFPLLEEPINLNIRAARCTLISEKEITPKSLNGTGKMWETGARFVAMSIGLSDRLYNQILEIGRQQIAPAEK